MSGESQGGALALASAALAPELVRICYADVPSMCDVRRGLELADDVPYTELVHYLTRHADQVDQALETVDSFDCALLASRIRARCLFSVGLMDVVCPPSTVFAAYNAVEAPKDIAGASVRWP